MKKEKKKIKKSKKEKIRQLILNNMESADAGQQYAYVYEHLGGKWKMRILWALGQRESMRYGEIKRAVEGITDMMLSQSLKELVSSELVARRQYKEIPPRVEYAITPVAQPLLPVVQSLAQWAQQHQKQCPPRDQDDE